MNSTTLETRRGARVRVLQAGPADAQPLVFLHGLSGLLADTTFFDLLAQHHRLFAPELPGYGDSTGEELLEDMLDFALHGWDVVLALGLGEQRPALVGHSLGGMIAAEMACLAPDALACLVLVDAFGLWLDDEPIPDIFSFLPFEFGDFLFRDPAAATQVLAGSTDVADLEHLRDFFIGNARRLGTAGKILFPIPNRRLSKRLYRLSAETLLVWGAQDKLIIPAYAKQWQKSIANARVEMIEGAGHMLPYEQPDAFVQTVEKFLG